ncbi:small ribosomal subunit biogenesis GTPase RsgA [Parendozoicomonas haliclonae]|uniref:Small ribosomal subunit biogenesis GTPase RsgA n=1 Tax=Parendozoicomonas haliclonae TaxID=1960125 RepID=A0A1X7ARC3_9GAMM|nr:small ribosomal subunit biogenesis GTPase RsgA [Parendozoicomonas haliclonae]SMA50871.1 putative ribosome biogenesis GTPase RsgA [Parendozoicomonas haliclonae]
MAKRKLNRRQNWRIQKIQEERAARASRREDKIQDQLGTSELGPEEEGLVIAHYGVQLDIERPSEPGSLYRCHLRANLPPLVTGDRIVWRPGKDDNGVVVAQLPRDSELCRPDNHGRIKPVAANIDYIVLVVAPVPRAHANLIDRYLVAAEAVDIEPVLLLNKTDLIDETNRDYLLDLLSTYRDLGYQVLTASTKAEHGLDAIKELLKDHTSVFVGQSGVGKSSLVNVLLPGVQAKVGELSEQTGKGMHTTTAAKLFHFPDGGSLIDSPGIREFGLWHMEPEDVLNGFREFHDFIGHCRFRDCKHEQEPGCALLEALEEGKIEQKRMDSYRQILDSLDQL